MKQAYVVVGPEASGNRLMVRMLVAAGCVGSDGYEQPFTGPQGGVNFATNNPGNLEKIALHRSLPFGQHWPDLNGICQSTREAGYDVKFLVMVRESLANSYSQLSHANSHNFKQAKDNYQQAFRSIFRSILEKDIDFVMIPYTSLGRKKFLQWLASELNLKALESVKVPFEDADAKYHEEVFPPPQQQARRPFGGLTR